LVNFLENPLDSYFCGAHIAPCCMPLPSFKSTLFFAAGFVSCLLCLAGLVFGSYCFRLWPAVSYDQTALGQRLAPPTFTLPHPAEFHFTIFDARNNKPVDFQNYQGRVIVLNFWATWCLPCQSELPCLGKLAGHYGGQNDVAVVCVSAELPAVISKSSAALESHAPLYSLNGQPPPKVYQSDTMPATYLIDKKGRIVFQQVGPADWSDASVIKFIDSLR
jgi:thiol-disulfide isomerase/thioredoxin